MATTTLEKTTADEPKHPAFDASWYNGGPLSKPGLTKEDGPGVYVSGFRVGGGPAVVEAGVGERVVCRTMVGFGVGDSADKGASKDGFPVLVVINNSVGVTVIACGMLVDGAATVGLGVVGIDVSRGGGPDIGVGNSGSVGNGVIGANVAGTTVGRGVSGTVGRGVGDTVGKGVGDCVGDRVGATVCACVGMASIVGWKTTAVGKDVGSVVGSGVGAVVDGTGVGASVGGSTGAGVGGSVADTPET